MAPLTLTIMGAGPAAPNPGGACSGYLLRQDTTAVLLDCGSGIVGQIPLHVRPSALTGVAISHFHPDHYFDLVPLYYMLKYVDPRTDEMGPLPIYLPPGGCMFMRRFSEAVGDKPAMMEDVFAFREYVADRQIDIGGLAFTFHEVQHYIMSHAMRVRATSGATLVFSSDVAPCPQLIEVARDADLFLCESAMLDGSHDHPNPKLRGHLSAAEAGQAARDARVKRLLITHYRSGEEYDAHHLRSARGAFDGPVELARPGATYTVG